MNPSTDESARFIAFSHPTRVASIDYPEHWASEVSKDMVVGFEFQSPEVREVCVGIFALPYRIPVAHLSESTLQTLLHGLLELAGATETQPSTISIYPARTGRTKDGCESWIVGHEDLFVSLSFHCPEQLQHRYRPLFERMLSSFRIHRQGAGDRLQLIQDVITQLKRFCGDREFTIENDAIKTEGLTLGVDNLVTMIARQPGSREPLIAEFVKMAASTIRQTSTLGQESWNDIQAKIFPMVRPDKLVATMARHGDGRSPVACLQQQLASQPWLADLVVCYAIDDQRSLRMINHGDLERWQVDMEQLHSQALANLMRLEFPKLISVGLTQQNPAVALLGEGGISAKSSYVFHPQLAEQLQEYFGGDTWIAIPARDTLVVFSKSANERRQLLETVAEDFKSSDHAISDRLFEPTPDGVVLS